MTSNSDRIDALADVALAIARAVAEEDRTFSARLEDGVRESLAARARQPDAFNEAMLWLERFERTASLTTSQAIESGRPSPGE